MLDRYIFEPISTPVLCWLVAWVTHVVWGCTTVLTVAVWHRFHTTHCNSGPHQAWSLAKPGFVKWDMVQGKATSFFSWWQNQAFRFQMWTCPNCQNVNEYPFKTRPYCKSTCISSQDYGPNMLQLPECAGEWRWKQLQLRCVYCTANQRHTKWLNNLRKRPLGTPTIAS